MSNKDNIYIIDTSSIIDLFRLYPYDIFPSLWKNLDNLIKEKRLISHEYVFKELSKKSDDAFKWAKERKYIFKKVDNKQIQVIQEIISIYKEDIWNEVYEKADPWLIALAIEKEKQQYLIQKVKVVVTEEKFKKDSIPFVCQQFRIKCLNIFGLMREESWKM
jgi:hypothetical protein